MIGLARWWPGVRAGLLLFCLGAAAAAGPAEPPQHPAPARRLEDLRREIEQLAQERDRLAGEEQGVLNRLEALAAQARWLDARLEELQLLETAAAKDLQALAEKEARAEADLEQARRHLRASVRLLQCAGPLARWRPLFGADDAGTLTAGLRAGHELSSRLEREVALVQTGLDQVREARRDRQRSEREVAGLRLETRRARDELETAIVTRRDLLQSIRRKASVRDQAISELGRAREELEKIIAAGGKVDLPGLDVNQFRGVLPLPVPGKVTRAFGDRLNPRFGTRLPHPGWDIQVPHGVNVRCPFDGQVVYADWMRGYGLLLVIDHGRGVHTVYAHLSAILVQTGRRVTQGQTLGRVGDTGSLQGPYLYLEIREQGKTVDPALWFNPRRHL